MKKTLTNAEVKLIRLDANEIIVTSPSIASAPAAADFGVDDITYSGAGLIGARDYYDEEEDF